MPGWLVFLMGFASYLVLMRWILPAHGGSNLNVGIAQRRVSTQLQSS